MFCWITLHYLRPPGLRLPVICKELSHKCFRCIQILPRILKLAVITILLFIWNLIAIYTMACIIILCRETACTQWGIWGTSGSFYGAPIRRFVEWFLHQVVMMQNSLIYGELQQFWVGYCCNTISGSSWWDWNQLVFVQENEGCEIGAVGAYECYGNLEFKA